MKDYGDSEDSSSADDVGGVQEAVVGPTSGEAMLVAGVLWGRGLVWKRRFLLLSPRPRVPIPRRGGLYPLMCGRRCGP